MMRKIDKAWVRMTELGPGDIISSKCGKAFFGSADQFLNELCNVPAKSPLLVLGGPYVKMFTPARKSLVFLVLFLGNVGWVRSVKSSETDLSDGYFRKVKLPRRKSR